MAGKREIDEVLRTIAREALLLLDCKLSAFYIFRRRGSTPTTFFTRSKWVTLDGRVITSCG